MVSLNISTYLLQLVYDSRVYTQQTDPELLLELSGMLYVVYHIFRCDANLFFSLKIENVAQTENLCYNAIGTLFIRNNITHLHTHSAGE